MPDLRIKIERDANGKVEATVNLFDTEADYQDAVTIYNEGNPDEDGIPIKVYFPGESALADNPISVDPGQNYPTSVTVDPANTTAYEYLISAELPGGGAVVIDPRFIVN